jgi:hypothetical protein
MSRIYLASSWRNLELALGLAALIKAWGHEVVCFGEARADGYRFHWRQVEPNRARLTSPRLLASPLAQRAVKHGRVRLDGADTCLLLLPCNRGAHLEAGYAKGQGKRLIIVGRFPAGEFELMYGLADALVPIDDLDGLRRVLAGREGEGSHVAHTCV